jgi:hypothetical protein
MCLTGFHPVFADESPFPFCHYNKEGNKYNPKGNIFSPKCFCIPGGAITSGKDICPLVTAL